MIMKNSDDSIKLNTNPNWPDISDHPHETLIIFGSGAGKINVLVNLIKY